MATSVKNNGDAEISSQQPSKRLKKDHEDAGSISGKNGQEAKGGHVEEQVAGDGAKHQTSSEAVDKTSNDKDKSTSENVDDDSSLKAEEDLRKIIKELQKVQQKISSLSIKEAFSSALEQEYNEIRRPVIEQRDELIKKIPDFWAQSFVNHPILTTLMEEEDEQCLHYMSRLEIEEFENAKSGFKIKFHFETNPYFENSVLVKEFHYESKGGEPASTSTPIKWKNNDWGERLREQTANRAKNDTKSRKRKSSGPVQTFFSWYLHYGDPAVDPIAKIFKEEMWLDPVQFFLIHDHEEEESQDDEDDEEDYEEEDEESGDDKSIDLESEEDEEGDEDDDDEGDAEEGEEEGEDEGSEAGVEEDAEVDDGEDDDPDAE